MILNPERRGSALLGVSVALSVALTTLYFSFQYLPWIRKEQLQSSDRMRMNLALQSLVEYTVFGVRQRWCFTDIWTPDNNCTLSHAGSVEAMLVTPQAIQSQKLNANQYPKASIVQTVQMDRLLNHPMYRILAPVLSHVRVKAVTFKIERKDNAKLLPSGRESFLKVGAYFDVEDDQQPLPPLPKGYMRYFSETIIAMYPRELSTFTLIVPNDLRLDQADGAANIDTGNIQLPYITLSPDQARPQGVTFQSPVFVNGDLHILQKAHGNKYTPVTFSAPVTLGGGVPKRDGLPLRSETAGAFSEEYQAQYTGFGGFLRGVKLDGIRDIGLDYLSLRYQPGASSAVQDLVNKTRQCAVQEMIKGDARETAQSSLVTRLVKSSPAEKTLLLGMTDRNAFTPQNLIAARVENPGAHPNEFVLERFSPSNEAFNGATGKAVLRLRLKFDSSSAERIIQFAVGSHFETVRKVWEDQALIDADKQKWENLKAADSDCPKAFSGIASRQNLLDQADAALKQATANAQPAPVIAGLQTAFDQARADLQTAKTDSSFFPRCDGYQNILDQLTAVAARQTTKDHLEANAPKLIIDLHSVENGHPAGHIQNDTVELSVKYENAENFLDDLKIGFLPYDRAYVSGTGTNNRNVAAGTRIDQIADPLFRGAPPPPLIPAYGLDESSIVFSKMGTGANTQLQPQLSPAPMAALGSWVRADGKTVDKAHEEIPFSDGKDPRGNPRASRDLYALEAPCAGFSSASQTASFSDDFKESTRNSWNFAPDPTNLMPPGQNNLYISEKPAGTPPGWEYYNPRVRHDARSVQGICQIAPDATMVVGFFVCDKFVISNRKQADGTYKALYLIGTVIANELQIDPSAYAAGVVFRNIFHPESVDVLQAANILSSTDGGVCKDPTKPLWSPLLVGFDLEQKRKCSPMSLITSGSPFRWTLVEPDCGPTPDSFRPICKNRIERFVTIELSKNVDQFHCTEGMSCP